MARNTRIRPSTTSNPLAEALYACRVAFAVVGLFSFVIDVLVLAQPLYMLQVYDRVLGTGRIETLTMLTIMAVSAMLILGILDALRQAILVRLGRWINARLAPVLLSCSVRAKLLGDEAGAQPLRDLASLQAFVGGSAMTFLFDGPLVPIFVTVVWILHPVLGSLALGTAVVLFTLTLINDRLTRAPTLEGNVLQIRANRQAETTIRNAEVVRAMGMLPAMVERWRVMNDKTLDANQTAGERSALISSMTKCLRQIVQVATLGLGALLVIDGDLTGGSMIACSILVGRALAPVEQAMGAWKVFTAARIAYVRLRDRFQSLPPEPERTRLPAPSGCVKIDGVSVIVPGTTRYILQQVSFTVEPGEILAVVGPSAAGKSTLCRVLVGLQSPTTGGIRLDGADLEHWSPDDLGQFIGYLPQDVELFAGTIRDNIARMGKGTDDAVIEAAELAQAHDMILSLADGYDTQIGDAGTRLSGGQRQRIGLARAVFGNPVLIVLDEPNANLDQTGESALAGALNELKQAGAAILIVGHRPSTLAHADKILLLQGGRVQLWGPRDEVVQRLRKASVTTRPPDSDQTSPAETPPAPEADRPVFAAAALHEGQST